LSSKSLIVIGGGPGGYSAALEAAQRKMSVTLVERQDIGGTCTNRGCIPSKFLLSKAKQYADALRLAENGIHFRLESVQPEILFQNKDSVVGTLRQRMEKALKSSSVEWLTGTARLVSPNEVEIKTATGVVKKKADAIILATGTTPVVPKSFPTSPAILNSTTVLELNRLPSHLVVLGGGYIGCELACAFQGLGCKVTLIEKEPRLLAHQPEFEAAGTVLQRSFEKRGMTVLTRTEVKTVTAIDPQHLKIECSNGEILEANALLLALGRAPNVDDLNPSAAGLTLENGRLRVNEFMQTSVPSIYAIGDMVSPLPLAHVATREGQHAVAHLAGEKKPSMDYSSIARCVYTWPEAAAVGLAEEQARQAGFNPRVDRYHLAGSSKAMVEQETEGLWMIVSDTKTHKVLGGQIVGPNATELIHLLTLSMRAGLTAKDILETVFAHPTLAEGFQEALFRSLVDRPKSNVQGPKS
jgi:dihydrolipoamide dehydrogenase